MAGRLCKGLGASARGPREEARVPGPSLKPNLLPCSSCPCDSPPWHAPPCDAPPCDQATDYNSADVLTPPLYAHVTPHACPCDAAV
eukprot:6776741-Prymnesium_polylepis.1